MQSVYCKRSSKADLEFQKIGVSFETPFLATLIPRVKLKLGAKNMLFLLSKSQFLTLPILQKNHEKAHENNKF